MRGRTTRPVNSTKFNSSVLIVWSRCQILTNWRDVIYSLFVCLLSDDVYRFAREINFLWCSWWCEKLPNLQPW